MPTENPLGKLIGNLQHAIANGGINGETLEESVAELGKIGYKYDQERFPTLIGTENYTDTSTDSPSNLAEALLWKLGKWKSYKRFSANYAATDPRPTKTDVVFFAFAKHLRDKKNPIYDQHAIRALWAICRKLTNDERKKCKSLLFDSSGKWKQAGSGSDSIECYELFVKHINALVSASSGASLGEIDRLLMPLGQAIKKSTKTYSEFQSLCGMPSNG